MDVLSYLKFWRPITTIETARSLNNEEADNILDEEDDSLFELEFITSDFDTNSYSYNSDFEDEDEEDVNDNINIVEGKDTKTAKTATEPSPYSAKVSPTLGDLFSRRRIIPLDTNSSPQSPISSPKMITPRFSVFMFKKASKSKPSTPKPDQETDYSNFTVKYNVKQVRVQPKLAGDGTLKRSNTNNKYPLENPLSDSKRFSKEALQKYLKLVKSSNVKVSCKETGGERVSARTPTASPASRTMVKPKGDNPLVGIRLGGKRLGKSKLEGGMKATSSPARRSDDSLAQQHDGIHGAILHCKRSFYSGRDMSLLSRSSSSPLYEKFHV